MENKKVTSSALLKLLACLKTQEKKTDQIVYNYVIPELWNIHNYTGSEVINTQSGNILVNPYKFLISLIEDEILPKKQPRKNYSQSIANLNKENNGGDWIKQAVAYSMMPRASAAFDHDRTDKLDESNIYGLKDTGTFVKSLALLPLLKKMGVNLVYMLPIATYTRMYKKGEMGSPYGVKDFYTIDKDLFDPITGDEMTLEEQFKAFVEACHIMGMRVALDYIPRTNARDSMLVLSHPEWFYWINKEDEAIYKTPWVDGVDVLTVPTPEHAKYIYNSKEVLDFIKLFKKNPKSSSPKKWEKILELVKANPDRNHLEIIEEVTGLTVAPAFADVMNDPQPAWTDVTFFRMYLDNPIAAQEFVDSKSTNPYMLFDIAKSSLNPGKKPNKELWDTLAGIIPYYQQEFGIDGMRIDMGHAIPDDLTKLIFKNAREIDPNFCFIAEELQAKRAAVAKELGYNMIIGDGFYMEPRVYEFKAHEFMYNAKDLPIPCFACCETHDTQRVAARNGDRNLARFLTAMNMFIPNTVPFINSAQEVYEFQPMNTGLDCRPNEAYLLDPKDPMYSKLALFDRYAYHYNAEGHFELPDMLEILSEIRNSDLELFTDPSKALPLGFSHMREHGIGFAYVKDNSGSDNIYLVIGHSHVHNAEHITCKIENARYRGQNGNRVAKLIFSTHENPRTVTEFNGDGNLSLWMQPGEVKIIKL